MNIWDYQQKIKRVKGSIAIAIIELKTLERKKDFKKATTIQRQITNQQESIRRMKEEIKRLRVEREQIGKKK